MSLNDILHASVQDAVIDWDHSFDRLPWGRLIWNPTHKYNYVIENLGWW